jgi:hypothetical protein
MEGIRSLMKRFTGYVATLSLFFTLLLPPSGLDAALRRRQPREESSKSITYQERAPLKRPAPTTKKESPPKKTAPRKKGKRPPSSSCKKGSPSPSNEQDLTCAPPKADCKVKAQSREGRPRTRISTSILSTVGILTGIVLAVVGIAVATGSTSLSTQPEE